MNLPDFEKKIVVSKRYALPFLGIYECPVCRYTVAIIKPHGLAVSVTGALCYTQMRCEKCGNSEIILVDLKGRPF